MVRRDAMKTGQNMHHMSVFQELVKNVQESRLDSFDEETIAHAKLRITDVVGCLTAGADAPGCATMLDLVQGWGGKGESTIALHGTRVPAHDAAMANLPLP